jgi:glutamine synthetase
MATVNVPEIFGSMVFNQSVMKEMLPEETYNALKNTMEDGTPLDLEAANQIAEAMKNWAISKGATHYSHWFQPLTGITAEKHDSFLTPAS